MIPWCSLLVEEREELPVPVSLLGAVCPGPPDQRLPSLAPRLGDPLGDPLDGAVEVVVGHALRGHLQVAASVRMRDRPGLESHLLVHASSPPPSLHLVTFFTISSSFSCTSSLRF